MAALSAAGIVKNYSWNVGGKFWSRLRSCRYLQSARAQGGSTRTAIYVCLSKVVGSGCVVGTGTNCLSLHSTTLKFSAYHGMCRLMPCASYKSQGSWELLHIRIPTVHFVCPAPPLGYDLETYHPFCI